MSVFCKGMLRKRMLLLLLSGLLVFPPLWSANVASVQADGAGVEAPGSFTATALSSTEVELNWEDLSDGEASFIVERKSAAGEWTEIADLPPNTETFNDDELTAGAYEYRIQAYIDGGFAESDDFEDEDIADWTVRKGPSDWSVAAASGSKRMTVANPSTDERIVTWGDTGWTDYTFTADILRNMQAASAQAIFRYTDNNNYYLLLLDYADDGISLRKRSGGSYPHVADASYTFVSGTVYHLKIETEGDQIRIYIDDQLVMDETDGSYAAGAVGFRITGGYPTYYDDVQVSGEVQSGYVYSAPVSTVEAPDAPDAPEDVTAAAGSAWHVELSWEDESDDETGFRVDRALEGGANWNVKTTRPNYYGTDYAATGTSGEATMKAVWRPTLPEDGDYNVYYWLPTGSTSYATDAPFTVYYDGGQQTYPVNEKQAAGGAWVLLGSHYFKAGDAGYVELTNQASGSYVIADAVKFERNLYSVIIDNDAADYSDLSWVAVGWLPADSTAFMSAGLKPETAYRYRVSAWNEAGAGAAAESNTVTTPAASTVVPGVIAAPKTTAQPRKSTSTFTRLNNGDLLMVYTTYFGGTGDLDYAKLAMVTFDDDGLTWSNEEILFEDPVYQLSSPSLLRLSNGSLGLTYFHNLGGGHIYRVYRYSTDDGATWSSEIAMTDGSYSYMSGAHDRLVQLSNGRLIFPVNVKGPGIDRVDTLIFASDDNGLTWQKKTAQPMTVEDDFFAEASIVETGAGQLLMIGNTLTGWFYGSRSTDYGNTWSAPERMNLPNPKAIAQVFKLPDTDALVFISNPTSRSMLTSQISLDGGTTWQELKVIAYESGRQFYSPSFYIEDETVYLAYCDIPGSNWSAGASIRMSAHPFSFFGDID